MPPRIQSIVVWGGVTWYSLLSDQRTGLNAITVPGTLRDSLILLAVVLEQQTELQPTHIMTDTDAYSDVVFGLFRLLGHYSFAIHNSVARGELRPLRNSSENP